MAYATSNSKEAQNAEYMEGMPIHTLDLWIPENITNVTRP